MSGWPQRRELRLDERTARREQRARRTALARDASQRPRVGLSRLSRPAERTGHELSTAHFQAAYPAVAEAGLGARGVYIGSDLHLSLIHI